MAENKAIKTVGLATAKLKAKKQTISANDSFKVWERYQHIRLIFL